MLSCAYVRRNSDMPEYNEFNVLNLFGGVKEKKKKIIKKKKKKKEKEKKNLILFFPSIESGKTNDNLCLDFFFFF